MHTLAPPSHLFGLTPSEVLSNRARHGENTVASGRPSSLLRSMRSIVSEPMFLLLVVAMTIYLWLGEFAEGVMMGIGIAVVTGISLYQERKSAAALDLLKMLTAAKVRVIREGVESWIESGELVVGDVVHLAEGEGVPADCRILKANDCAVNEALLTGESLPVPKSEEGSDLVYRGTHLVGGQAYLEVSAVGEHTRLGSIDRHYQELSRARSPMAEAVRGLVRIMAVIGVLTFLLVVIFHWLQTGDALHALMTGLALTMAILPEEIPVAFSVFMALGAKRLAERGVLVREPHALESLASVTTICLDKTGTLTRNEMEVGAILEYPSLACTEPLAASCENLSEGACELLAYAMWASEVEPFDPMERAIHDAYERSARVDERPNSLLVHEYPLGGTPPSMTHVFEKASTGARIVACKGAPEGVLALVGIPERERTSFLSRIHELSARGLRVLAVARADPTDPLPDAPQGFRFELLGAIALRDPIRVDAPALIARLGALGVRPVMVTGDAPHTAREIARQVGMIDDGEVAIGRDLHLMNREERERALATHTLFARIDPELKLELIETLRRRGEIVAMTGDGVNDALALKAAHVGIAMGERGAEIARQAASFILMRDDLGALGDAFVNGRRVFDNLQKAIYYIIAIHIPVIGLVALPVILGWDEVTLFSPIHVVFLELLMGPTCSIVYENEPAELSQGFDPPRSVRAQFLSGSPLRFALLQGMVVFLAISLLVVFLTQMQAPIEFSRAMAFATLVLSNMALTMVSRSRIESLLTTLRYQNSLIPLLLLISLFMLTATLSTPLGRALFGFAPIGIGDLAIAIGVAAVATGWFEWTKWRRRVFKARRVG